MSLQERAKNDLNRFTSNDEKFFSVNCVIKTPDGQSMIDVKGLHTRHWMAFDPEGVAIHTAIASLGVSEKQFIDAGFTVRDANDEINLKGYLIDAPDSRGILINYVLREVFPDENIGFLVLILSEYKNA